MTLVLISTKDGRLWPRHQNGDWFSDAEWETWHKENVEYRERLAVSFFNYAFGENAGLLYNGMDNDGTAQG